MYDIAIVGGTVIDPERDIAYRANVGVSGARIAAIADAPMVAKRTLDARGCAVAPGFIDVHTHADGNAECANKLLRQGVTSIVTGNCGLSVRSVTRLLEDSARFPVHQATMAGHSTLRELAGASDRYSPATAEQVRAMRRECERMLREGACGVSLGLEYAPGTSREELTAMAEACAAFGGVLSVHTRVFSQCDLYSLSECLQLARQTGVRLLFSHFVYQYGYNLDLLREAVYVVTRARESGLPVWLDSGLYPSYVTWIDTAVFDEKHMAELGLTFGKLLVLTGEHKGKRLTPELYRELRENQAGESVGYMMGTQEAVLTALSPDYAMVSSDAIVYRAGEGHPQIAGTFAKYIRLLVREEGRLTQPQAARKAALLPAQVFGFARKGRMAVGMDADIAIYDPATLRDHADFPDRGVPDAPPTDIRHVLVNGSPALCEGELTGELGGTCLLSERSDDA